MVKRAFLWVATWFRLSSDKAGVLFVPPYQHGSSGTGSVSVDMQKIWALSGTEGDSLSTQVIKASSGRVETESDGTR